MILSTGKKEITPKQSLQENTKKSKILEKKDRINV